MQNLIWKMYSVMVSHFWFKITFLIKMIRAPILQRTNVDVFRFLFLQCLNTCNYVALFTIRIVTERSTWLLWRHDRHGRVYSHSTQNAVCNGMFRSVEMNLTREKKNILFVVQLSILCGEKKPIHRLHVFEWICFVVRFSLYGNRRRFFFFFIFLLHKFSVSLYTLYGMHTTVVDIPQS